MGATLNLREVVLRSGVCGEPYGALQSNFVEFPVTLKVWSFCSLLFCRPLHLVVLQTNYNTFAAFVQLWNSAASLGRKRKQKSQARQTNEVSHLVTLRDWLTQWTQAWHQLKDSMYGLEDKPATRESLVRLQTTARFLREFKDAPVKKP